jgi:phage terminase large subunit
MATATIALPPKLKPVFLGEADVRGAHGGRGSAKSRSFAKMTAVRAYIWSMAGREGIILCARQWMNSLSDSSLEEIKLAIRSEDWLAAHFEIGETFVRTKDGRIAYSFAGLSRNLDSIKSKARILLAWVEEAEQVTEEAWVKLIPTLREEDSELWLTWNPEREDAPTNRRFHTKLAPPDARTKIVELNYRDNPWFPKILERQRLKDKAERPTSYSHIWEGDFLKICEGAYFASNLLEAQESGRIGHVAPDPLMEYRAFWDIGTRDATAIWVAQFVGREIRVLDYYEAVGQPLAAHLGWLRDKGYGSALCVLPHDGERADHLTADKFADHIQAAGFRTQTVKNQGKGAAMKRVEAARRLFPSIWFNEAPTEPGRAALGWYHEKRDEQRNIGLGPEHDWSSHGADAFGLMCVAYEEPREARKVRERHVAGGWMGR